MSHDQRNHCPLRQRQTRDRRLILLIQVRLVNIVGRVLLRQSQRDGVAHPSQAHDLGHLFVLKLFFLFYQVAADVLLAQFVQSAVNTG